MSSKNGRAARGLREVLDDADVLLVMPPFVELNYPSLGLHILQACGHKAGFRVRILYANLALAAFLGEKNYNRVFNAPSGSFAGERYFAHCAFGAPHLGRRTQRMFEPTWILPWKDDVEFKTGLERERPTTLAQLRRLEARAEDFIVGVAQAICEQSYKVVGCSTTFEQTAASVALLNQVKRINPEVITILGGANCEGEMAEGMASLRASVDYIFSGESEATFADFVLAVLAGAPPPNRIVQGKPCSNMDSLPTPDYSEYYKQRRHFLPKSHTTPQKTEILYQTSRGCWWGERQHCTFCGLNGEGMAFRQKSPDRVIEELRVLASANPARRIVMADNIMPYSYFKTLLPRLAAEPGEIELFYEQKANLSLDKVLALMDAGITWIQPGVEALSSSLLKLMKKGVQARQNLMLLRYARLAGMRISWNLLWGFPGDELKSYEETLALIPLLQHLEPPSGMFHLSIDRFSPYFSRPAEFGIRKMMPVAGYRDVFPRFADIQRLAYHFTGLYDCDSHKHLDVIWELWREVERWQSAWGPKGLKPRLDLRLSRDGRSFILVDTRSVARKKGPRRLQQKEAAAFISPQIHSGSELEVWALREKLAVVVDGWFVPLAVAAPQLFRELMEKNEEEDSRKGSSGERANPELHSTATRFLKCSTLFR